MPLDAIDGFAEATPSAKLRELIRDLGLLQRVVVTSNGSDRYELIEGRRRCKAIAQLTAEGRWPAPPRVEALILDGAQPVRREVRGGVALALHATRSASAASELREIEAILKTAGTDREATTVKEIAAQTGMSIQTVRRRLRLRSLTPALRAAFNDGRITASVAEAAARLPEPEQKELADELAQQGRLTLASVRHVARERSVEARAELPDELFADRELPWKAIVCGHIITALSALPDDNCPGQLAALLKRALAEAERA
ncbi:MAG: ParB/RepB/Spo0J family partition protein [Solirubrobacteraceae bacterium]